LAQVPQGLERVLGGDDAQLPGGGGVEAVEEGDEQGVDDVQDLEAAGRKEKMRQAMQRTHARVPTTLRFLSLHPLTSS